MRKQSLVILMVLSLSASACGVFSASPVPNATPTRLVGHHISGLTLYNGDLYFGAGYCLYRISIPSQTVSEIVCTQDWTFQRPAVDGKRAYAQVLTSPAAAQFLVAVDLSTGETTWRIAESEGVGPYWRDMKSNTLLASDQVITVGGERFETEQRIYAFDTRSGHPTWQTELNYYQSRSTPFLIHDDLVWYVVDREKRTEENGTLVAIDSGTGQTRQIIDLREHVEFDELLYVDAKWILGWDDRGMVFAVDRTRPEELAWHSDWLAPSPGSHSVSYNGLFNIATHGLVYALEIETGKVVWTLDPDAESASAQSWEHIVLFVLPGAQSNILYALDAQSGAIVWQHKMAPHDTILNGYVPQYGNPRPVVSESTVYIGNKNSVDALNLNTGELLWRIEVDSRYDYYFDPL